MAALYKNIYTTLNKYRRYIPITIDIFIAIFSYFMPYALSGLKPAKIQMFERTVLIYTAVYIITFIAMRSYKNMWRYSGMVDLYRCLVSATISNIFFYVLAYIFDLNIPYYVCPMAFLTSCAMSTGVRIIYRAILIIGSRETVRDCNRKNAMIIGAGQATSIILSEISFNNPNNYSVKCIIDDDRTKIGRNIRSIPIVSDTTHIIETVKKYNIEEIIISIPSLDKENKKRILDICADTQCKLRILPEIYSLITDGSRKDLLSKLRDVHVEDLLGRDPVQLDCHLVKQYIAGKVLLVTGGGGSIGSELCRQISSCAPKNLIILDIYENNAYNIQQELIRKYGDKLNMEVEIASIRDKNKLEKIFSEKKIDIVFHAAAHKHVPLMEKNPEEAIKNNIIGTYNLVMMADKYKAGKFVLISTDKAVNPTNIMGATKRVCEMIIQTFDKKSQTDYVAVRFGNVLGSNGSVIPLFINQIKDGGPVTVTHEDITRYFMTIPEAVQLVMQSSSIAKGGEIFVLDMGEPVKIRDLAVNLIRLSGLVPNKDIKIEYTGLRPGEKLYEELLITENSGQVKTELDKIFIEEPIQIDSDELFESIRKLEKAAHDADQELVLVLLEELVPTYKRTLNEGIHMMEDIAEYEQTEIVHNINTTDNKVVFGDLKAETA